VCVCVCVCGCVCVQGGEGKKGKKQSIYIVAGMTMSVPVGRVTVPSTKLVVAAATVAPSRSCSNNLSNNHNVSASCSSASSSGSLASSAMSGTKLSLAGLVRAPVAKPVGRAGGEISAMTVAIPQKLRYTMYIPCL
jgi:hypothetical protein